MKNEVKKIIVIQCKFEETLTCKRNYWGVLLLEQGARVLSLTFIRE